MKRWSRKERGFTLIQFIIAMVIVGILITIALPKYIDLTTKAKISATQRQLGVLRSFLNMKYSDNAMAGNAVYPSAVFASDFESNKLPMNHLTNKCGINSVAASPGGTATHATDGFWFIVANGQAGAYSDGTEDTSNW